MYLIRESYDARSGTWATAAAIPLLHLVKHSLDSIIKVSKLVISLQYPHVY